VPRDDDLLDDLLSRRDLLDQIGRRRAALTVDDVALVLGKALKEQRRAILDHVNRLMRLEQLKKGHNDPKHETHYRTLWRRLDAVESALRRMQRERAR